MTRFKIFDLSGLVMSFKLLNQLGVVDVSLDHIVQYVSHVFDRHVVSGLVVDYINHKLYATVDVGHIMIEEQWVLGFRLSRIKFHMVPPSVDVVKVSRLVNVPVLGQPLRVVHPHRRQEEQAGSRDSKLSLHD